MTVVDFEHPGSQKTAALGEKLCKGSKWCFQIENVEAIYRQVEGLFGNEPGPLGSGDIGLR